MSDVNPMREMFFMLLVGRAESFGAEFEEACEIAESVMQFVGSMNAERATTRWMMSEVTRRARGESERDGSPRGGSSSDVGEGPV